MNIKENNLVFQKTRSKSEVDYFYEQGTVESKKVKQI